MKIEKENLNKMKTQYKHISQHLNYRPMELGADHNWFISADTEEQKE